MAEEKKDARSGVGISISSTPDKTEITRTRPESGRTKARFPFRMILVSNLEPEARIDDWSEPRKLRTVDRNKLQEFMQETAPELNIDVANFLDEKPTRLEISLRFASLSEFRPESVAKNVPSLSRLLEIRSLILAVGEGRLDAAAFKERLGVFGLEQSWSERLHAAMRGSGAAKSEPRPSQQPETGDAGGSPLDNILGMVDIGSGEQADAGTDRPEPARSGSTAADLVGSFSRAMSAGETVHADQVRPLAGDIARRVAKQVSVILNHERFRALESAWRGLKFLVDQIDFRADVSLDVLAASDEDFAEAVHYQVLMPEHEGRSETPASLLVFDRAIGCDSESMEALEEIAGVAESLQTPAVATISHRFFGFDRPEEMGDLPVVWQHLQGPEYVAWNKFTESSAAALVSLALPSVLLREPHEALEGVPLDGADVEGGAGLWGSASLAVAALAANRFAQTGWPTGLAGPGEHEIAERPLWASGKGPIPLAAAYSSGKQGELADEGFTVLTCSVGSDGIRVHPAPTAARFRSYEDEETTRRAHALRNLDAQLFIARIVHFLVEEGKRWSSEMSGDEIRTDLETGLQSLLGVVGDSDAASYASVRISGTGAEEQAVLDINVTSPPSILAEAVTFSARIPAGNTAE